MIASEIEQERCRVCFGIGTVETESKPDENDEGLHFYEYQRCVACQGAGMLFFLEGVKK